MGNRDSIYTTTRVYMAGNTPMIYLERWWGIKKNSWVKVKFFKFKDQSPDNKLVDLGAKKVCGVGSGLGIYIGVNRGVTKGDIIVARITEVTDDPGVTAEETVESSFE